MRSFSRNIVFLFIILSSVCVFGQNTAIIYGKITDKNNKPVELANIAVLGSTDGTTTDKNGNYELKVPANKEITIAVTFVGYKAEKIKVFLSSGERKMINKSISLTSSELPEIEVTNKRELRNSTLMRIDPKTVTVIPSVSGGIESILKTLPGVSSNNELSSQYSVRGGNYDENLVYVNDIEIYRPFLVRSSYQEGLSFVNSDLVSSILFSAGGFDAKYGDKMSSVLDIKYKKPQKFAGSASGSLLGSSVHIEDAPGSGRLSYLLGIRQKSNQYVLKSMETKGDYKPSFTDVQTFINYKLNEKTDIAFLGNYARNFYKVIPQTRETDFGTINEALRLTVYFDGQEIDNFETYMGALSTTFRPTNNLSLKFITSAFRTFEGEAYDIQGQYWLDELEKSLGEDEFGEKKFNRGVGTFLNHARNNLNATVVSAEHKGMFVKSNRTLQWGVNYKREVIHDKLHEWRMLDSAGFSIPHPADSVGYKNPDVQPYHLLEMQDVSISDIDIFSNRYSGYVQNTWSFDGDSTSTSLTMGVRTNYWDFNSQFLVSPRATFSYKPNWKRDIMFRFSTGYYHQPPFYRELRDFSGNINNRIKAQESVHFVAASDWNFTAWDRPFKFISELYYKYLNNLIPYEIDNVRIRYYAENNAHGYAAGVDMKVNGEFVKGVESWASLSVMQTQEDIENDFYYDYYNKSGKKIISGVTFDDVPVDSVRHEPGYIPRPTDQRVSFSIFFQDYLPRNPSYKMHLNLVFGSSLPFGPPTHERYKAVLRIPPYRRVDIGFSKQIKGESTKLSAKNFLRHFKTIWLSTEVFNLLQVSNTVSYIWIADISNRMYAVPNYLTPRQINIRLVLDF